MWKEVAGYGGFYEVSDLGEVRTWWVPGRHARSDAPRTMRATKNYNLKTGAPGYLRVGLKHPTTGRYKQHFVHTMVLEAFAGPRAPGAVGSHLDGDRLNNSVQNLRWESASANVSRKHEHGTMAIGERNHNTPFTAEQVVAIRREYANGATTQAALAARYGVSQPSIGRIVRREVWRHV